MHSNLNYVLELWPLRHRSPGKLEEDGRGGGAEDGGHGNHDGSHHSLILQQRVSRRYPVAVPEGKMANSIGLTFRYDANL